MAWKDKNSDLFVGFERRFIVTAIIHFRASDQKPYATM